MVREKRYILILFFIVIINLFFHFKLFLRVKNVKKKDVISVPNNKVKIVLPDFAQPLMADLLWIKIIGNINIAKKNNRDIGNRLFVTILTITELDPFFYYPYILGVTFLCSKYNFNMFSKGVIILNRAIKFLPEKWEFPFLAGYYYFFERNKPVIGIKYFFKCLKLKTTPYEIKKIIPFIILKMKDKNKGIKYLKKALQSIKDENLRIVLKDIFKKTKN